VADPTGFLTIDRQDPPHRPVSERVLDFGEVEQRLTVEALESQAARCMDCGIPFCHAYGCPLANLIPDWNDAIHAGEWRKALDLLHATNNFPEITGRICPAPCEPACTLSINQPAVTIKHIELMIAEHGWEQGWIQPEPPSSRSGKRIAVIGSGPSGLGAAQQLARWGHETVVFERAERVGGLLRYGIPDFKLDKRVIDRRVAQMEAEGVVFETGVDAGVDLSVRYMRRTFDAILITAGARQPRDLDIPGRQLEGVHFATTFLTQQNQRNAGEAIADGEAISAAGKRVVVIGGGDTGADCIGTSRRQGAQSIHQLEILSQPPAARAADNPWPAWPQVLRTSTSHEEGCERMWGVSTQEFAGQNGGVTGVHCARVICGKDESGRPSFEDVPGSELALGADLVLLAMGFVHVEHGAMVNDLGLATDPRGNISIDQDYLTSADGVFAAGDAVLGASLVVRSIDHGRRAAEAIHSRL